MYTGSVGWNQTEKNRRGFACCNKTKKLFPDDTEGMGILGSCLRASGNFDESLKDLNKAIEINPNYAEALKHKALISLAREDKINALSDLEKAHKKNLISNKFGI